ncbi:biogenesis of lysosome-related organelles complex 1, subunit 3 [Anticarsia gemmatalis]|uniref:biogenesis of lysosome-related organelles complex 1, subunit 3 n=1 Tax=Anticarsia gemmatalis TaxID=129554 RepID=UPI003F75FA28
MSKNAHVVDGEASESDSEIEIGRSPDLELSTNSEAFVIAGEAPESDDETKIEPLSNSKELDLPLNSLLNSQVPLTPATIYNSLLHQKLWECNVSFRATIEGLIKHTTDISVEKLTRADKTLLNVQESMRATNANLTLARARLKQLHGELEKANCSAALPNIKIK